VTTHPLLVNVSIAAPAQKRKLKATRKNRAESRGIERVSRREPAADLMLLLWLLLWLQMEDDPVFTVDKILDSRINSDTEEQEYLVRWADYPDSEPEWVREQNIEDPDLLRPFKRARKNRPGSDPG
jgi:hypothetical protein